MKQTLTLRVLSSSIFFPLEETVAPLAASALGGSCLVSMLGWGVSRWGGLGK